MKTMIERSLYFVKYLIYSQYSIDSDSDGDGGSGGDAGGLLIWMITVI
jgi:hypothetical protein